MAGHSKFKNIQHRKGAQDAKRAKVFTKIGREIMVAAKMGGPDPGSNPRLRLAIQSGRAVDMPNERIKRAIDSAAGAADTSNFEEIAYEGYGPGGVAVIVEALTDNRNRTATNVRSAFTKYGGNLGETNSVSFMFDRVGEILYPVAKTSFDAMFEAAVEAGADDCQADEEHLMIYTATTELAAVRDALEAKFGEAEKCGFVYLPNVMAQISEEQAQSLMKMIDVLEDDDDVQVVTTNLDISEELMEKLMAG